MNLSFWEKLSDPAEKPFAVELTPPAAPETEAFMAGARELQQGGADLLTVTDSPGAVPHLDAALLACKVWRETGMEVMPHMTCRDRNQIAAQALLMGLAADGIRQTLIVTGDPIPVDQREQIKSVYQFSSRKQIAFVDGLNGTVFREPFHIFAALNVNARNFPRQLNIAREKEEAGAVAFLTQPVFTREAADNLALARQELKGKLLAGIMPIVSHKNALYLQQEVAGIRVDPELIARYEGLGKEDAESLALEVSLRTAETVRPWTDGFYLITPFRRTGLICRLMAGIRESAG